MSAKSYYSKRETGRHSAEISLQKYARAKFSEVYGIPFEMLQASYQTQIHQKVTQAYYSLKNSR